MHEIEFPILFFRFDDQLRCCGPPIFSYASSCIDETLEGHSHVILKREAI